MSENNLKVINQNEIQAAPQSDAMHPMVAMAMGKGDFTPETLDKLLQVQKDWEANEARKAYAQAMAVFRAEVPAISRDAEVDFKSSKGRTHYRHETLDGILRTIAPALSKAGIAPTFSTNQEGGNIKVTCRVTHSMGHFEETSMESVADNSGNKNSIQAMGSTITYLQRYTLKALLGLSAGNDNDGNDQPQQVEYITDQQEADLRTMIADKGMTEDKLISWLNKQDDSITALRLIPRNRYESLIAKVSQ